MPALYVIVGYKASSLRGEFAAALWPVAYRMTEDEANAIVKLCNEQRERFVAALTPILSELDNVKRERKRNRNMRDRAISQTQRRGIEAKLDMSIKALQQREAEICAQYAPEMFDPLFPSATNGWLPDSVLYRVLDVWDDPREMGPKALMLLRATLHATSDANDGEDDEDDS